MGDGMARLLFLALAIASAPNGLVLVDEVENGLHHTVMERVWRAIAAFARNFNVQIFATTHSQECIEFAHSAFASDRVYDFRLYRLERANGVVRPVKYDREMLDIALESGLEVC
jgi:AAA15 family ATPase/GTPase